MVEFRVLSYNVRSLRDDRCALLRVVRACEPDLVCVQESPRFFRWRTKAASFAHDADLSVVTGGADASGNLLLSSLRVKPLLAETVELDRALGLHRRSLALAVVRIGGTELVVGGTHLSLDAAQRARQAGEILDRLSAVAAERGGLPILLGGDFNEHPEGDARKRLAAELTDAYVAAPAGGEFTSTAANPYQRIDAIYASAGVEVVSCGVPADPVREEDLAAASDHRPVLAVVRA